MKRLLLAALTFAVAGALPALASETIFTCPAGSLLMFRDGPDTKDIVITVGSKSLTVKASYGAFELPAQIETQGDMMGVRAWGKAATLMPDKAAVDSCLDKKKKEDPSQFEDGENAYLAMACKQAAAMTAVPVPVTVTVDLTVMDPPNAQLSLSRRHADEAGSIAEVHGVDTIGQCTTTK